MKGLLLKDTYVILKQMRAMMIFTLVIALIPVGGIFSYAICYAVLTPITALAYDERAKWNQYAAAMPYSSKDMVFSKYLLGYVMTFGVMFLVALSRGIYAIVMGEVGFADSLSLIVMVGCIALLMQAVNLPPMFKFGVEKCRMIYNLLLVIIIVCSYTLVESMLEDGMLTTAGITGVLSGKYLLLLVVVTMVVNLISVKISEKLYAGK